MKKKMSDSPRSVPDWLTVLAATARQVDGAPPFSDQALVDYRTGVRELVALDEVAAALVSATEAEFVVNPDARGHRLGTRLLETLLDEGATLFWAHGDHPAARALAASHGLAAVRKLLHLTATLPEVSRGGPSTSSGTGVDSVPEPKSVPEPESVPELVEGPTLDVFHRGQDEAEWVALNALIFRGHPEQGSVTQNDLEQLETEPWFSADNFLLLRDDGRMIGYCWLKIEGDRGEFYVVGVHSEYQGRKLGSLLFEAGLSRLRELGIRSSHLYVEGDNAPALALYRSRGFAQVSIDIQYASLT
jgi:mycothiol synthase